MISELSWLIWLLVAYVGACVGSFLNVVIYRLPHGLSLLRPGSHCPVCKTPLGLTENIPILGWLWLRGRCKHCQTKISWRYPAVEALTMGLYLLSFWALGIGWQAALTCVLMSWLVALALIDFDTFELPEALTRSGLVVGAVGQLSLPWLLGSGSATAAADFLLVGIFGAVVGIWGLELIGLLGRYVFKKEAMGLGDGKLLAMIGMWLGWQGVVVTLFSACLVGVIGSVIGMGLRRVRLGRPIPFGPYLAMGGALAALAGPQLVQGYLGLIGLG